LVPSLSVYSKDSDLFFLLQGWIFKQGLQKSSTLLTLRWRCPWFFSDLCSNIQGPPKCINCVGDHLATSYDSPRILKHRMALSFAATENIPFADALKSVNSSSPSSPTSFTDPGLDFHNFPFLPRQSSSRSHPHFFSSNSFSPLSNLPSSDDSPTYPRSFSSTVKNATPLTSRTQRIPRIKQPSSSPTSG